MVIAWWFWIVGGIALVLAELLIPSFFIVWFGLGAILVGLSLLIAPELSLTVQLAEWTVASIAMVWLWFRVFRPNVHKTLVGTSVGEVIGEVGLLVTNVAPFIRGKVRFQKPILGSDEWVCLADHPAVAGDRVRIIGVEGSFLRVEKSEQEEKK